GNAAFEAEPVVAPPGAVPAHFAAHLHLCGRRAHCAQEGDDPDSAIRGVVFSAEAAASDCVERDSAERRAVCGWIDIGGKAAVGAVAGDRSLAVVFGRGRLWVFWLPARVAEADDGPVH